MMHAHTASPSGYASIPPLIALALLLSFSTVPAQVVPGAVALPDSITGTRTLSADTVYQLVHTVRVCSGGLLSIPPGTLIYGNGEGGTYTCLQVERGGILYARGTASRPIIFTSPRRQYQRSPGDWGGLIVLGNATINVPGGTATLPAPTGAVYGGADDADSSGVLEYVRIEYAGGDIGGARLNGLTLAGVGNRTVVERVQVSYSGEDAYEMLGGTANGRRLVALGCVDDDLQTTEGYRGRLQFFFALRDSTRSDPGISNGMEAYNDATGSANTPLSRPVISNATFAGPFRRDTQATGFFGSGGHWRNNTRYGLFNSVITGWQEGIRLDGAGIAALPPGCPQPAELKLSGSVVGSQSVVGAANGVQLIDAVFWFICGAVGNANPGDHPLVALHAVTQSDLESPDPRPVPGTQAALTSTDTTSAMLAAANNFTFTNTRYRGAFDPNAARNALWDTTWTNYRPGTTTYIHHRAGWSMVGLANRVLDSSVAALYPDAASQVFRFTSSYVPANELAGGSGYWIKLDESRIVQHVGAAVLLPQTIPLQPGWNLISTGATEPASVASVTPVGTTLESDFFGFHNGYVVATTLEPGKAYWVKASTAGSLVLNP